MAVAKKAQEVNTETEEEMKAHIQKTAEPLNPASTPGNYAIVTESGGQRRVFAVFNGTIQITTFDALGGAFELK